MPFLDDMAMPHLVHLKVWNPTIVLELLIPYPWVPLVFIHSWCPNIREESELLSDVQEEKEMCLLAQRVISRYWLWTADSKKAPNDPRLLILTSLCNPLP